MRVIAGIAGGIPLKSIKSSDVRPTLDRVKEAVFNMIAYYISDSEVLDLFAGFGGIGIEALSRGAAHADFVEINRRHNKVIKENIEKCSLDENASIFQNDVYQYLESCSKKYDLIFMDPPYQNKMIKDVIESILRKNILKKDALIITERSSDEKPEDFEELEMIKNKNYGNSLITIYKLK